MNRIGVLVELDGGDESTALDVAMHVAAMNPPYATPDQVPPDVLQKEKRVLMEQALESGKPAEIVEKVSRWLGPPRVTPSDAAHHVCIDFVMTSKMAEGRMRKYLEEICLVSQNFVKDSSMTVQKYLESKDAKMIGFSRIVVGEGIEKKQDDFAGKFLVASVESQRSVLIFLRFRYTLKLRLPKWQEDLVNLGGILRRPI